MVATRWHKRGIVFAMADALGAAAGGVARPHPAPLLRVAHSADLYDIAEYSLERLDAAQTDWADLAERAIEPNAFYEPGFALSAARHFPVKARPHFIVVWGRTPATGEPRMMGLFPIMTPHPLIGDSFIRLWLHKQAALATPLVDRDEAAPVIAAFLDWLEERSAAGGVMFSRMTTDGPFHRALTDALRRSGRDMKVLDSYQRAALFPGSDADALCTRAGSKKKLGELRRQQRRLRELGRLTFHSHETPEEIRVAGEEFLALEASGWKAGRGALLSQPDLATFMRSATRLLAREGRCKIQALRLDGRPIAMAIVLESQKRSYCWKLAFDETLRAQAPGVQLVYEQTKAHLARTNLEMADSCAIANHPMIDKLWPDRVGVCDLAAQLQRGRARDFSAICRTDSARRGLRALAKRAAVRLLKRKVS